MTATLARLDGPPLDPSRSRRRGALPAAAAILALALLLGFAPLLPARPAAAPATDPDLAASPSSGFVRARSIGEVLARWTPETHLYVLGDIRQMGLEEAALRELAGWLEGKHWTVVLVQDASGERFTDAEG